MVPYKPWFHLTLKLMASNVEMIFWITQLCLCLVYCRVAIVSQIYFYSFEIKSSNAVFFKVLDEEYNKIISHSRAVLIHCNLLLIY